MLLVKDCNEEVVIMVMEMMMVMNIGSNKQIRMILIKC